MRTDTPAKAPRLFPVFTLYLTDSASLHLVKLEFAWNVWKMKFVLNCFSVSLLLASLSPISGAESNLTCYQCTRNTNVECEPHELLPCPPVSDRCVTHISKNAENGFSIKRECGLGPCGFDDVMVNKGLGFDNCDRSRDEYFCIICCRESGCNKSKANQNISSNIILLLSVFLLNFFRN